MLWAEVVDELAPANLALRLPNEKRADGVFAEDGIVKAAYLVLAPYKSSLNVGAARTRRPHQDC